ncbi:hypothetical protein JCM3774_001117 [Rhodotorula dairenensis]
MGETHPMVRVVVHWVPGHVGINGNEEADKLAKLAVVEASWALARLSAARAKRARAKRGLSVMAFDPKAASKSPSSDGGDSEYDRGARRGDFAMTTQRIADRAPSTYKAALRQQWAVDWSAATTGAGLRAIAKAPPVLPTLAFTPRSPGANRLGCPGYAPAYATYRAHFDPEKELCDERS